MLATLQKVRSVIHHVSSDLRRTGRAECSILRASFESMALRGLADKLIYEVCRELNVGIVRRRDQNLKTIADALDAGSDPAGKDLAGTLRPLLPLLEKIEARAENEKADCFQRVKIYRACSREMP